MTDNDNDNKDDKQNDNPQSFIVDPTTSTFLTLDDISVKLTKLLKSTNKNQELLSSILQEHKDDADEGEYIRLSGTVDTSSFTIINTHVDPGHSVKGYTVINDGPNTIYVGHNVAKGSIGPDIVDVSSDITRFTSVKATEDIKFRYNRNKIRNVYILASGNSSKYRALLIW